LTPPQAVPLMVAPFELDSLDQAAPEPEPPQRGRHAAPPRPRVLTKGRVLLVVALVLVLAADAFVLVRLRAPAAAATITSTLPPAVAVSSHPVALPWAAIGQSAISVPSLGVTAASGSEVPVPIASLTKLMTAYVVLQDHPIALGQSGPKITLTPADVADYETDTNEDEANAPIVTGEVLTEQQMLEGMLVHSANDFADALADWDAGSVPAFVAKMNQTAAKLGMAHTHYADASGYSNASQSTAGDVLIVAGRDMGDPDFASIVRMPSVSLPVAGTLSTYTPLLGVFGVEGVKSGFTSMAGGCDVLAVTPEVHGHSVLILAAVTGQTGVQQPDVLLAAGEAAFKVAAATVATLGSVPVVRAGTTVAHVSVAGHTVDAVVRSTVSALSWPGVTYTRVLEPTGPVVAGDGRGTRVGSVVAALGTQRIVVPVRLSRDLPRETLFQRIF
jgi:D-alanyl-D-alanine carboxypeptidase (penicillin-binding protein 5/6)